MPNSGSAAVDAHFVPKRNLKMPILWIAGTPETTMYTEMSTTQHTASIPHRKKMKFITASSQSAGVRGRRTRRREEVVFFITRSYKKPHQPSLLGQADAAG